MSRKETRKADVLNWLLAAGGTTTKTNAEIAEAIESVKSDYTGSIRVSEVLRDMEDAGDIIIERGRRHPQTNPSGRIIRAVTF